MPEENGLLLLISPPPLYYSPTPRERLRLKDPLYSKQPPPKTYREVLVPWDKLTDKPVIYSSLGALVNGRYDVYKHILEAVEPLEDVQVVLSVGKNINPENLGTIPSNTIVVRSAPKIELLNRAALCITHAGLNTTLESD